jgi:hypothetical protein
LDFLLILGEARVFMRTEGGNLQNKSVSEPRSAGMDKDTKTETATTIWKRGGGRYPWEGDSTVTASGTLAGLLDVQVS